MNEINKANAQKIIKAEFIARIKAKHIYSNLNDNTYVKNILYHK